MMGLCALGAGAYKNLSAGSGARAHGLGEAPLADVADLKDPDRA